MSSHVVPKEHRERKPKKVFKKSKQLLLNDLYNGKNGSSNNGFIELDSKSITQSVKRQNKKIIRDLIIVLVLTIPLAIIFSKYYLNKLAESQKDVLTELNQVKLPKSQLPFNNRLSKGYKALEEKNYSIAIDYFQKVERINHDCLNGTLGLLYTYKEMCEEEYLHICEVLNEKLMSSKVQRYFDDKKPKDIVLELSEWRHNLVDVHSKIPLVRNSFKRSMRSGYLALNRKDYSEAISYFNYVEKNYSSYINGAIGLLATYDEMCSNKIESGCDLFNKKLSTFKVKKYFQKDTREMKIEKIRKRKKKLLNLHIRVLD